MSETTLSIERSETPGDVGRGLARQARRAVHARLRSLRDGHLTLVDPGGRFRFGDPRARLRSTVWVRDPAFYTALALRGSLGGAEAFIDELWSTDDLPGVIRILARNRTALAGFDDGLARWMRPALRGWHRLRRNTRDGSRRNIAAHYDLGNDFFELFLDPTLSYSSGIFERTGASMEEASVAKLDRVCRKLEIGPRDHVLEIGTGWGGFAIHAALRTGCRVTTTTISQQQYELARSRVREAGLEDRVRVLCEDYRDLQGSFDKLVSIEMIEAVGHRHLDDFFRVCSERLRPNGLMALQAITVDDRFLDEHRRNVDFIKRYIFPGGELVSIGALAASAARSTDLRLTHVEDLTPHYAETLRRWRERMNANRPRMKALGLDDAFLRMWEFYLCYCEGGFEEREIGLVQAVFEKPAVRRDSLLGSLEPG